MKTPNDKGYEWVDEAVLYIKEQCIDVNSDPGLVWFDFNKAKTLIIQKLEQLVLEGQEKIVKNLFHEYDEITNPGYTFMINKSELDAELLKLKENKP